MILAIVFVASLIVVLTAAGVGEPKLFALGFFMTFSVVVGAGISAVATSHEQYKIKEAEAQQTWIKNGCYVYDYECGGKAKYSCSIKTNEKNAVMIGNQI